MSAVSNARRYVDYLRNLGRYGKATYGPLDVEGIRDLAQRIEELADVAHPRSLHGEAFKLMLYRCELDMQASAIAFAARKAQARFQGKPEPTIEKIGCGKEEWIWNSRDGVTPFGVSCECGEAMFHVEWERDIYAPKFKPLPGSRFFADGTREEALSIVGKRWQSWPHDDEDSFDDFVARSLEDFPEGWPTLRKVE